MSMRTSSALAFLMLLAACGGPESPPPEGDRIDCAIGADADFSKDCTLERVAGTKEIILHHPDGGFRRMTYDPATGALAPIDGAETVTIEQGEGVLQFTVGNDRYRIPREPSATPAP